MFRIGIQGELADSIPAPLGTDGEDFVRTCMSLPRTRTSARPVHRSKGTLPCPPWPDPRPGSAVHLFILCARHGSMILQSTYNRAFGLVLEAHSVKYGSRQYI